MLLYVWKIDETAEFRFALVFFVFGGDGKRWSNWTFCWFVCLCTNFECYMLILFELKANANTNFSTIWCICLVAINFLFYNHHRWNANAKWAESAFSNQTDEICNPQAIKKSTWHVRRTHSRFAVLRSLQENNRLFIYWISFCLQRLLLSFSSSSFVLFCFHYISETSVFFRVSQWSGLVWSGHHPVSESTWHLLHPIHTHNNGFITVCCKCTAVSCAC